MAMKSTLKGLRHDLGAKDAELAITKAEAEAFRRQLVPGAGSTLHADTEVFPPHPCGNTACFNPSCAGVLRSRDLRVAAIALPAGRGCCAAAASRVLCLG